MQSSLYFPSTFPALPQLLSSTEVYYRSDPTSILFAIIDKIQPSPE